jgi:hypothetical protein
MNIFRAGLFIAALLVLSPAMAVEQVTYLRDGQTVRVEGKLITKAADGGLLLLAPSGELHAIQPDEIQEQASDDRPFAPLSATEAAEQLLATLPPGFQVYRTAHFVICYDTSRAYAEWCGSLFERLYRAFFNFWQRKGLALHEAELPLVAVIFADQAAYAQHAKPVLGDAASQIIGFYNLQSNRVTMYDLTGLEALRGQAGSARGSAAQINRLLKQPQAEAAVATIIHEATHQLAYNTGMHHRFADVPLWVSEGMAIYFESPDLESAKGWRSIGAVNRPRVDQLRTFWPARNSGSLPALLADDGRFRDTRQALNAYAEAWALNYFLLRTRQKDYVAYLKKLAEKPPMVYDDEATRLAEFREAFGQDLQKLDADFTRGTQKLLGGGR